MHYYLVREGSVKNKTSLPVRGSRFKSYRHNITTDALLTIQVYRFFVNIFRTERVPQGHSGNYFMPNIVRLVHVYDIIVRKIPAIGRG